MKFKKEYKHITQEEFNEKLELHELWLDGRGGERLVLRDYILTDIDMRNALLSNSILEGCIFDGSDLSYSKLYGANISCVSMNNVNLKKSTMSCTNLDFSTISNCDMTKADLSSASLVSTNLYNNNMKDIYLSDVDVRGVKGIDLFSVTGVGVTKGRLVYAPSLNTVWYYGTPMSEEEFYNHCLKGEEEYEHEYKYYIPAMEYVKTIKKMYDFNNTEMKEM